MLAYVYRGAKGNLINLKFANYKDNTFYLSFL